MSDSFSAKIHQPFIALPKVLRFISFVGEDGNSIRINAYHKEILLYMSEVPEFYKSIRVMAKELGSSHTTIQKHLKELQLPTAETGQPLIVKSKFIGRNNQKRCSYEVFPYQEGLGAWYDKLYNLDDGKYERERWLNQWKIEDVIGVVADTTGGVPANGTGVYQQMAHINKNKNKENNHNINDINEDDDIFKDSNQVIDSKSFLKGTRHSSCQSVDQTSLKINTEKSIKSKSSNLKQKENSQNSIINRPVIKKDCKNDKSYTKQKIVQLEPFKYVSDKDRLINISRSYLEDEIELDIYDRILSFMDKYQRSISPKELVFWIKKFGIDLVRMAFDSFVNILKQAEKGIYPFPKNDGAYIRNILNSLYKEGCSNKSFALKYLIDWYINNEGKSLPINFFNNGIELHLQGGSISIPYDFNEEIFKKELINLINKF